MTSPLTVEQSRAHMPNTSLSPAIEHGGVITGSASEKWGFRERLKRQLIPGRGYRTHLTLSGWMLVVLSLAVGGTAYNSASNILFLSLSLMLSALVFSGLLTVVNFKGLSWIISLPKELRAGSLAVMRLRVSNAKRFFPSFGIGFRINTSAGIGKEALWMQQAIPPGKEELLLWRVRPRKRGLLEIEISGLESSYPFGFIRKQIGGVQRRTLWVWPQRVNYIFKPLHFGMKHWPGTMKARLGQGDDLVNIRRYEAGDPLRMIHWKASARSGNLMIRQVADRAEDAYYLQIDSCRTLWRSEQLFESYCSLMLSLAEDLFQANRMQGYAIHDEAPIRVRSVNDLHAFFDRLARLQLGEHRGRAKRKRFLEWVRAEPEINASGVELYVGTEPAGRLVD
jgi:uncharacterized protein (DUF58 family)